MTHLNVEKRPRMIHECNKRWHHCPSILLEQIKTAKIECLRCVFTMDTIHENRNTVAYKKVAISNKQCSDTEFQK